MRLTTKGRYAVTAMLDLALHQHEGPVALSDIAMRQELSQSYLEQLFSKLRRGGLVDSVRGPSGGYLIAKGLEAISIAQIINAIDELVDTRQCGGAENCRKGTRCLTHDLWEELNHVIFKFLDKISLAQLIAENNEKPIQIFNLDEKA